MTWVKICGMTNLEDALVAVEAGADAVGFVFYEKSPRCVSVEAARRIVEKLPESVEKVGVFASGSMAMADEVGSSAGLDALQVYPSTGPTSSGVSDVVDWMFPGKRKRGQRKMYLALPISKFVIDDIEEHGGTIEVQDAEGKFVTLLIDSGGGQRPGGTGAPFDWNRAAKVVADLSARQTVAIAGGLTPGNVGEAMEILKPWGVDVASGVEERPGKKDPEKVRAFVRAVREMDGKVG